MILAVGAAVVPIGLLAMATGIAQEVEEGAPDMVGELIAMSAFAALFVVAGIVLAWVFVRLWLARGTPKRHFRLDRFAAENYLVYRPGPYPGSHVTPWRDRGRLTLSSVMHPVSQRSIEFANYELTYGTASSRNTQFGGYCAVRLSTPLPHIVLQARGGAPTALLSAALPTRAQQLSLEGDFDEHFALYCPEGYERDALYLFTPDIMARLIDRVKGFDVEIIDDWMFLVSRNDVVTLDPARWAGLMDAAGAMTDKIGRWERWRDERGPDSTAPRISGVAVSRASVAEPGRRLRMSGLRATLLWAITAIAILGAIIVANLVA